MSTIDRNEQMTTIDQASTKSAAASPFFIAAVGMTIALVVVAAVVAMLS